MAVLQPSYVDPKTGKRRKARIWWTEFTIAGRRVRESTKTTRKTLAVEYEKRRRLDLERAIAGVSATDPASRVRTVAEVIKSYGTGYPLNHRASSVSFMRVSTGHVDRLLGQRLLIDLNEDRMKEYVATRMKEGASGRSINAELGELSRAVGKPWRALWPRLRKLEENHDVGQALAEDQQRRLLDAADRSYSPNLKTLIRMALLTGARAGELTAMKWGQLDFARRTVTVGKAKTAAGTGRVIPMNEQLFQVLSAHAAWFTGRFGETKPSFHVFPWGSPLPRDPTRATVEIKTAWKSVRKVAGVQCRWHDLRHTAATNMGEAGVPEATLLEVFGWMSQALIRRYSHVRLAAKRTAVESLRLPHPGGNSDGVPKDSPKDDAGHRVQ